MPELVLLFCCCPSDQGSCLQCDEGVESSSTEQHRAKLSIISDVSHQQGTNTSLLPAPPMHSQFSAGSVLSFIHHMVLLLVSAHGDKFGPPLVLELLHILLGSPWCGVYDSTPLFLCVRAEPCMGEQQDRKEAGSGLNDLLGFHSFVLVIPIFVIFYQNPMVLLPWKVPGDTGLYEKPEFFLFMCKLFAF